MKAAMIGLGKLGLPCAEVMSRYHDMVGYDISAVKAEIPVVSDFEKVVKDRELIFVAVQTPHDPIYGGETPTSHLIHKDFDYSHVAKVLNDLDQITDQSQTVVLISTCLPGTVRSQLAPRLTKASLIYNPYLIAMGTVKEDMVNPEMIIVGLKHQDDDASKLKAFYEPMMRNNPRYMIGTWEEAEATKIFYNTFISAKLALVNMIQDVAERISHMNVDVVTDALAKSTQRIMGPAYMKAGLGDGGHCHPRDNIALSSLSERLGLGYDLFGSIMQAREAQAQNMASEALKWGSKVVIVGKAYKPGVPYTGGSCSLLIGHYIEEAGGRVHYYDPNTGDTDHPGDAEVYLIAYWEEWVSQFRPHPNTVVIDPWRRYPKSDDIKVIHYGNTR